MLSCFSASVAKGPFPSPSTSKLIPSLKVKLVIPETSFVCLGRTWTGDPEHHWDPTSAPCIPLEELLVLHDELGELVTQVQEKMLFQ